MHYPWFECVSGDDIEQGDIVEACDIYYPVVNNPPGVSLSPPGVSVTPAVHLRQDRGTVIVMSQTCDLVKGREKVDNVLLCAVHSLTDYPTTHHLGNVQGQEEARRGNLPAYHMLGACVISGHEREIRIVQFKHVITLPLSFVRSQAANKGQRLRLLPPYREHLSQAFARYFMRVGIPSTIPEFRKK